MSAFLLKNCCSRAANRTVKTLVITTWNYDELHDLKYRINSFSLASKPSMQPLMKIPGETFPDYPMTTRLNKWNILRLNIHRLIDTDAIEQIVTIFSAVIDLKFMTFFSMHNDTLVSLLQHPNWQCQLTNLMVKGTDERDSLRLARELITAINGLTTLQLLAFEWDNYTDLPDMSILAQLKTVVFKSTRLGSFLCSLGRNAADNADLKVHLLSRNTNALLTFSPHLHNRIVRYGWGPFNYTADQVPLLCSQFRSLTSLSLRNIESSKVGPLFTDLSQLHQLIHLEFGVDFSKEIPPPQVRPPVQLNSLQALELGLNITSHSQIKGLNLKETMPNLKTIYIWGFNCSSCGVSFGSFGNRNLPLSSSLTIACFGSTLFQLHPRVDLKRIILVSNNKFISAEKLLFQGQ